MSFKISIISILLVTIYISSSAANPENPLCPMNLFLRPNPKVLNSETTLAIQTGFKQCILNKRNKELTSDKPPLTLLDVTNWNCDEAVCQSGCVAEVAGVSI